MISITQSASIIEVPTPGGVTVEITGPTPVLSVEKAGGIVGLTATMTSASIIATGGRGPAGISEESMAYAQRVDAGTAGQNLGATVANTASSQLGHMAHSGISAGNYGPYLPLAAGDAGVRSVQSCQFSAASASAGMVDLVLCRPLFSIPLVTAYVMSERDLMNQLPSLPRIHDNAVLGVIIYTGAALATGVQYQGYLESAWG